MKLSLLALFTTLATTSIHALEYTLSQDDITPDFVASIQEDTVYNILGDIDFSSITSKIPFTVDSFQALLTFQGYKSNNLTFSPNTTFAYTSTGGPFDKDGGVSFKNFNNLVFEGRLSPDTPYPTALMSGVPSLTMENINSISFRNFHTIVSGGVISDQGSSLDGSKGIVLFKNVGNITFDLNSSTGGGAIDTWDGLRFEDIRGTISFTHNRSMVSTNKLGGGAIFSNMKINFINTGNILFQSNHVDYGTSLSGNGGAIYVKGGILEIANTGNVDFLNNSTGENTQRKAGNGGAVYINQGKIFMSADKGNITFRGNTKGFNTKKLADGLYLAGATVAEFSAQRGCEIRFYDPLTYAAYNPAVLDINKTPDNLSVYGENAPDFSGAIRFSGEFVHEYITQEVGENNEAYAGRLEFSKYSLTTVPINLHNGALIIEHGALVGYPPDTMPSLPPALGGSPDGNTTPPTWEDFNQNNPFKSEFNLFKGILEIRNQGILSVKTALFSGKDAAIRSDGKGLLIADTVDMSKGFSFEFLPFLGDDKSGLFIIANSITLGGSFGVADVSIDYYSDRRWKEGHRLMVINLDGVSNISGSLDDIASNTSGSEVVDSPYAYQGTWSYEWVDNELFAIWTYKLGSGILDVEPELEGNIVSNSMWSSASNAKALSNTALANANILRFESTLRSNFWVKGIGDFAYDDSTAELDGYSYQGGGYAAGADFKLGKKSIVGVAFGQLIGDNKSELYTSKIKQDSMMGSLYAAHLQTLNKRNSLLWTLVGTYGDTENSMNTHYSDGENSFGSWNNNTYFVEAKMEWQITPEGKRWTYKPFIGVEYTDVCMDSFTESGDKVRHFAEGSYKNIALPIGIGFEHQSHFGKKTWLNSLSLAYVPDVYREAPNTQATRLSNGFSWKDQGSKPSIHTLRATINSTLQLNAAWTAYAGYTFEAREDASYHNVSAGVSYSF